LFGGRVKFIFNASDKVIEGHYSEAKMLIHPNIENFGLSPLEAAACGCPSIVARGSGVLEVLKEGTDILAYAAGNIDELHATINKFESDLALANKIKINAWKKAKRLSWDKHYSKLHKLVRGHAVDFDF
jgi:glycosyltransferase involved in cell wall biosynthesis